MAKKLTWTPRCDKVIKILSKLNVVSIENIKEYTSTGKRKISDKTLKTLEAEKYIKSELFIIDDKQIKAYSLDTKGKRKALRAGYNIYNSNSNTHDICLSENVFNFSRNNNVSMDNYYSEKELEELDISTVSRTDGRFFNSKDNINICIEQTTLNYTKEYKEKKRNYAKHLNAEYIEF